MGGRQGRIRVGTSGWTYGNWQGAFYPDGLPRNKRLAYLSGQLDTVEINGTFYSLTRPEHCDAWRAQVRSDFVFAIKGSRYITHMLKLDMVDGALGNFFASGILRLGRQLGPILWQLPASLGFDPRRAAAFFSKLPKRMPDAETWARKHDQRTRGHAAVKATDGKRMRVRHAIEIRNESWLSDEAFHLMKRYKVALVAAQTPGRFPFSLARTTDFAYLRLHGSTQMYSSRYTDREIGIWARRIKRWARAGDDVYVYFDNDAKVHAPRDALRLRAAIGRRARPQTARQKKY